MHARIPATDKQKRKKSHEDMHATCRKGS